MSEEIDELVPMNRTDIDGVQLDTTLLGVVQEEREAIYEDDDLLTDDELDFDSDNNEIDEEIAMSEKNNGNHSKQRSGYVRRRGCDPKPPSKSGVTIVTIAGLQAQVKDKDERISQMEELISKQREEVAQIQAKLFNQKEEVTAERLLLP
ncbi:hypothetical protein Taro_020238 [Colocasia esculenta]|uniref:Uncharacterized protein n=1 Tax=Colocasia esculenta TaxID=4460 RepID=A0A843UVV2_COLES|nr:hypothetical protein [Colocasia esculenta]